MNVTDEPVDGADAAALHVSSPVLLLGGPSPAQSELTQRLRALDVKVLHAPSAEVAHSLTAQERPRLLVVDARSSRRVPETETLLAELRRAEEHLVALIWFDAEATTAEVLAGCAPLDDHILGNPGGEEAVRRLHLLSRRLPARREGERLVVGDLEMDTSARTVRRGDHDIDLSETEFRLLRLLMRHARTVLSKTEILQQVWEYEFAGQANIVELYISYVRKKVEAGRPRMIHTVRGAGYVLRPAEPEADPAVESAEEHATDE
ncbi:response regulator transcription factor [Nesterenkonia halophila]